MTEPPSIATAVRRELRAPRAAGVAGLAFAALFIVSVALLRHSLDVGSNANDVVAPLGLYIASFSGIAFLWFIAVIRSRIGAHEDQFYATVFLGSGLLFVAMFFAATAAAGAAYAGEAYLNAPAPSAETLHLAQSLAYTFLYIFGMRTAAIFIIVASTIGRRTGTLPRWLAMIGFVIAIVLLLSISFSPAFALLFPAWVTIVSVVILLRPGVPGETAGELDQEGAPPNIAR
jgi:hypothetical protein